MCCDFSHMLDGEAADDLTLRCTMTNDDQWKLGELPVVRDVCDTRQRGATLTFTLTVKVAHLFDREKPVTIKPIAAAEATERGFPMHG